MKSIFILIGVLIVGVIGFYAFNNYIYTEKQGDSNVVTKTNESKISSQAMNSGVSVTPISHATMILEIGGMTVYTDPVGGADAFASQPKADIVVITDIHGDHLSTSTLEAVVALDTTLVVPQAVADLLPEPLKAKAKVMANDETLLVRGVTITAVPMYNIPETDDSRHTKGRGNGYLLEGAGSRVYIAGDTGPIPEMKALKNIDMAFIPMNLPYTMSIDDAALAVLAFAPTKVYPYHYRQPDGLADVAKFKTLVNTKNPSIEVVLLEWYQP